MKQRTTKSSVQGRKSPSNGIPSPTEFAQEVGQDGDIEISLKGP
jgi:hypothetical protein